MCSCHKGISPPSTVWISLPCGGQQWMNTSASQLWYVAYDPDTEVNACPGTVCLSSCVLNVYDELRHPSTGHV